MKFVEVIKECEAANGAGSKNAIKEALAKLDQDGRKLVAYAMDPYKVFGVKKFDRPAQYAAEDVQDISPLFRLLDDLASRDLTGDAARGAVSQALSNFTEETASYLERVIDKDPRAGFSADTFNKVWKDEKIPTFEVMLADKCESDEDFEKYITFPCYADIKYDGQRTIAIVRSGIPVEYRARSGKESEHLNGLFDEELHQLRETLGYDFILDGEAFASDFTETINAKKAGNDEANKNMRLRAFFLMPLSDWIAQSTTITMKQNREALTELLKDFVKVTISDSEIVNDFNEMTVRCNHVIDDLKQEGLILKDFNAVYTWDRSYAWCKVKRFYPADARIIGFYYGRPKSRLQDTIGGAIVAGYTEDGVYFETAVGSGFIDNVTDKTIMPSREEMMKDLKKYIGLTAVLKYQEVSRTKSKKHASLRFPTIEYIRDDKIVEMADDAELDTKGRVMIEV